MSSGKKKKNMIFHKFSRERVEPVQCQTTGRDLGRDPPEAQKEKRQRKVLYSKYLNVTDGNCLGSERHAARGECEYLIQNQDWVVTGRDCEQ